MSVKMQAMRELTQTWHLPTVPPVFKRGEHVLILLQNQAGNFILGTKKHYPQGISRLVGGGKEESDPTQAAQRELEEELGIKAALTQLKPLTKFTAEITSPQLAHPITFVSYLYFYRLTTESLQASSDLDGIVELILQDYQALITRFQQLSSTIDPDKNFAWSDYGQVYSVMHQAALDAATYQQLL